MINDRWSGDKEGRVKPFLVTFALVLVSIKSQILVMN